MYLDITLWDELNSLMSLPLCSCHPCTCGNIKALSYILDITGVTRFLMGIKDSYDTVCSQLLLLDPLSSVNKVYSMVHRVEKQREVSDKFKKNTENAALFARSPQYKAGFVKRF